MKKILFAVVAVALLTGVSTAQSSAASQTNATASQNASASASAAQATDSGQIAAGTTIRAELAKSVDAKKAKQGDEVVAKTSEDVKSNGQVVIPKGSKVFGHVTEAKAREKGESGSTLGIAFDKAIVKGGREIPLNATIQALAASQSNAPASNEPLIEPGAPGNSSGNMAPGRAGNGGMIGGAAQTAGAAAGTATNAAGNVGAAAGSTVGNTTAAAGSNARLSASSQGVAGLPGLSLSAAAANNTQASVISSQNKNVKLDSGTQMLLRVNSK